MFPIIEKYVGDTYVRNNEPVKISYQLKKEVEAKANKVFSLVREGKRGLVFSDIIGIRKLMVQELEKI